MYESLPVEAKPQLKNPYDAVALLSHACMLVVGFRLVGLGEDHKIGISPRPMLLLICNTDLSQRQPQNSATSNLYPKNGTLHLLITIPSATPMTNPP